ncbi:hypothetical protein SSABA_v1c03100 [Spiroplasma sabaudiense Ar-1343]|uniref:Uncharacterized protein n=1 Tax=Spiroplasma sabaudiense Ar-1343 TaxID=1276257 RepID=W6A9P0_9MOLU|nr:DUF192 domain-containing protein [Spiroplasma sabaudiense]AHI53722.1 hypothetical protein SSABA_v1c03100 [Spiroplasma sabaudiense Ar-1343]
MKFTDALKVLFASKKTRSLSKRVPRVEADSYFLTCNEVDMNLEARFINNFSDRFNSFYTQQRINNEEAFVFKNIKGFTTFGFRFPIDIAICNKNGEVLATYTNFPPQKLSSYFRDGYAAFCLAKGTIKFWNIKISDVLKINKNNF